MSVHRICFNWPDQPESNYSTHYTPCMLCACVIKCVIMLHVSIWYCMFIVIFGATLHIISQQTLIPMLIFNAIVLIMHFLCVKSLFVELNRANWEMKSQGRVWRPFKAPTAPVWSTGRMREEEWEVKRLDWCVPASSGSTLQSWDYLELLKLSSLIPSASLTLPACTAAPSVPIRFIFFPSVSLQSVTVTGE